MHLVKYHLKPTLYSHMRILSIDVGIKNLALCSIDASGGGISDWQVINLCDKEPSCQHPTRKGLCGKSARFSKNNLLYCSAHAAKSGFQLPKQVPTCATLKKLDDASLRTKASQLNIADGESLTKAKLASKIRAKMLEEAMITIPPQNANTIELPELARILQKRLDTSVVFDGLDEVIIENQISPIANHEMLTVHVNTVLQHAWYSLYKIRLRCEQATIFSWPQEYLCRAQEIEYRSGPLIPSEYFISTPRRI